MISLRGLWRDDGAQASIEYILMLATAAMLFLILVKVFFKPVIAKLAQFATKRFDDFFQSGDLHRLPFGR